MIKGTNIRYTASSKQLHRNNGLRLMGLGFWVDCKGQWLKSKDYGLRVRHQMLDILRLRTKGLNSGVNVTRLKTIVYANLTST